jgi:hypothetical protein
MGAQLSGEFPYPLDRIEVGAVALQRRLIDFSLVMVYTPEKQQEVRRDGERFDRTHAPIGCLSQAVSRFLLSFRGQKMEHEIFAGPDDAH